MKSPSMYFLGFLLVSFMSAVFLFNFHSYEYMLYTLYQCQPGYAGDGVTCGMDSDFDGFPDENVECQMLHCRKDNCPKIPNSGQENGDGDSEGDRCDHDRDGDGWYDFLDNCPLVINELQKDTDNDRVGDACDNCREHRNRNQSDTDGDSWGDVCDDDIDADNNRNEVDNCPYAYNPDQSDIDQDGVGDLCDNCPYTRNEDQADFNENGYGDACDNGLDSDNDGVPDSFDNCPFQANAAQANDDDDSAGNACDEDSDGDGVYDLDDNCPYVHNSLQFDVDNNGRGDVCEYDYDEDGVDNRIDSCPANSRIWRTNFKDSNIVHIGRFKKGLKFEISDEGRDVYFQGRSIVSMLVQKSPYEGFDFTGVMHVRQRFDDDMIGLVFGYQNPRKFYLVSWKRRKQHFWLAKREGVKIIGKAGLELKVVDSATGRSKKLRNALWSSFDYPGQTKVLWRDNKEVGWQPGQSYYFVLQHRPLSGEIRVKVMHAYHDVIADSGVIRDTSILGGRVGLYTFSQDRVVWSRLNIQCNDTSFRSMNDVNA